MSKKSKPVKLPKHKRVRKGRDAFALVRLDIALLSAQVNDLEREIKAMREHPYVKIA